MKTTTIFEAMMRIDDQAEWLEQWYPNADDMPLKQRRNRQLVKLTAALLRRIEEGDAAREALKMVEFAGDYPNDPCFWCDGTLRTGHRDNCPRQFALGIKP